MPFSNPIVGGEVLVIPSIKSPNYVAGSSGWRIARDGSVEFNNGTFRGSVEIGNPAGAHSILANSATGDAVDVYNSANKLVFSIDSAGDATSFDPTLGVQSSLQGGYIFLKNTAGTFTSQVQLQTPLNNSTYGLLNISALNSVGNGYTRSVADQSEDGSRPPTLLGTERNVAGSIVQADRTATNNLIHAASYSGTTNASGHLVFSHGCNFTPTGGVVTGTTPGGTFANLTYGINSLTSTQADVNWTVANTAAPFANNLITFDMLLWG